VRELDEPYLMKMDERDEPRTVGVGEEYGLDLLEGTVYILLFLVPCVISFGTCCPLSVGKVVESSNIGV
jgi:hypothetical protein